MLRTYRGFQTPWRQRIKTSVAPATIRAPSSWRIISTASCTVWASRYSKRFMLALPSPKGLFTGWPHHPARGEKIKKGPYDPVPPATGLRLLRHTLRQHLADCQVQVTDSHRFQDEGINPQGLGFLRHDGVAEPRVENDRNIRPDASQLMGQYLAGHGRHGIVRM